MEGMLPAPKACAFGVMKAKTMQSMSNVEVEPHPGPDNAILTRLAAVCRRVDLRYAPRQ